MSAPDLPAVAPVIGPVPVPEGAVGAAYSSAVNATGRPATIGHSLSAGPDGMTVDAASGVVSWTPGAPGTYDVRIRASNGTLPEAVQEVRSRSRRPPHRP